MKRSVTYIVLLAVVAAVMLYLLFRQPHPERSKDGTLVIFNWEDYLDKGIAPGPGAGKVAGDHGLHLGLRAPGASCSISAAARSGRP